MRLNLGCGENKIPEYTNVDYRESVCPDLLLVIGGELFPYEDNTVEEIYAHHSFEHFPNFLNVVRELSRISKNGCVWKLTLPYATSTVFNLVNPYHVNPFFTENTFRFFDDVYPREQPDWFKLKILKTEFEYNISLYPELADANPTVKTQYRHKYLNVVTSFYQELEVVKN